jgi:hypothetical protein
MIINIATDFPLNETDKKNLLSISDIKINEFSNEGLWEESTIITQIVITSISSISLNILSNTLYDIIKNYRARTKVNEKTLTNDSNISIDEIIEVIKKEIEKDNTGTNN